MRMNWLSNVLLMVLVTVCSLDGHINFLDTRAEAVSKQEQESPLQVTINIMAAEYCSADSELDGLRMKVRLTYTNRGNQQLILYKGIPLVSRIIISQKSADAAAKRFEVNSSLTQLTTEASKCYQGAPPNRCFVFIPPNGSFEAETVIGTFVVRGDAREIAGAVKSGNHILQVELITWHESDEMAKKLRARWLRYGLLWYEPIISAPVSFAVQQQRNVKDCS